MHVLHIISGLGRGGAETMLAKLVGAAGRHRHSIISLGEAGSVGVEIADAGVAVHALRLGSMRGRISGAPRLLRLIRRERPDVIQGWMGHGNLVATLAHFLAEDRMPLLWNVRQSLSVAECDKWLTRRVIAANARLSRRPTMIFYNSTLGAEQHEAIGYAPDKRRLVPNGFNLEAFRPSEEARLLVRRQLGVGDDELLVGLVARFDPWKNHRGFFQAASLLLDAGHRVKFLLAGIGMTPDNRELMALIDDRRLIERCLLLGNRDDVPALNAALDVACNVSHGEGFPNTIGEAMACAVPCMAADVGDCRYIIGDTGIVCAEHLPAAFAAALGKLIEAGPERRRELGHLARARIESHFSLPAVVAHYDELFEEALDIHGRRRGLIK